ncbi:MAG: hypothetical protein HC896_00850 [Bacteroidales bacterium]|nr:hypothetical protein [Bacteroidales bacterium]
MAATEVKDQNQSSTCWSFSVLSLMESELILTDSVAYDFSEMFIVRQAFVEKAMRYVRMHGNMSFTGGGTLSDVMAMWSMYGILPEGAYRGMPNVGKRHDHKELDETLHTLVNTVIANVDQFKSEWLVSFNQILDVHLGKLPPEFKAETKNTLLRLTPRGLPFHQIAL